jgi:MIP family channel proteins
MDHMKQRDLVSALLAEGVGTFFFFFVGMGAVMANQYSGGGSGLIGVAFAHGLALALMVSAFGYISGGHFNPAVSIGVAIARKITPVNAVLYIVAQCVGAVIAAFALKFIFPDAVWTATNGAIPALGTDISVAVGIAVEAILTGILLFMVLMTAVDDRAPKIAGFAIGLAIVIDILMGGPLTGAAMNPARWFGPAIATQDFTNWYVWIVGPVLGGAVATLLYLGIFKRPEENKTALPGV